MSRSRIIDGEHHYPVTEDLGRAPSSCFTCGTDFPCQAVITAEQKD